MMLPGSYPSLGIRTALRACSGARTAVGADFLVNRPLIGRGVVVQAGDAV